MNKLVVAFIHAKHPRAIDFNARLTKAQEEREVIVSDLSKEAKSKFEELGREYEYTVVDAAKEPFLPQEVRECEPVRVVRKWCNKRAFELISEYYGVTLAKTDAVEVSPVYYRVNDVVVTCGIGIQMIKPHEQCTREELEELKAGHVARRLMKSAA